MRIVIALLFSLVFLLGTPSAYAEDVYVGSASINATGSKALDYYLMTETISITNDVCYAKAKALYRGDIFEISSFMFCFSPSRDRWVYKMNRHVDWHDLSENGIAATIFYDYIEPRR